MLVIQKNGGPYSGMFDLPGGALCNPETLLEGIKREFLEETGFEIEVEDSVGCYEVLNDSPYNGYQYTHHIVAMYKVTILNKNLKAISKYVGKDLKEENDSVGVCWVGLDTLKNEAISPLVEMAFEILKGKKKNEIITFRGKSTT